jgi:hypothetical protein
MTPEECSEDIFELFEVFLYSSFLKKEILAFPLSPSPFPLPLPPFTSSELLCLGGVTICQHLITLSKMSTKFPNPFVNVKSTRILHMYNTVKYTIQTLCSTGSEHMF